MPDTLTVDVADRFAHTTLGHVTREYPHHLTHVLVGPADARPPAALHPVFYGSFDWHSCVHGYWLLARVLRRFPEGTHARAIRQLFDRQFTPGKIVGECAYFARPAARGFERPYGWAWLLKLAHELTCLPESKWATALSSLAILVAQRLTDFLPLATYPVRVGAHPNTAFGLCLAADYAHGVQDDALADLLVATAQRWYGADADCPAWGEPGGDDFLSSTLIEAECMRKLLPRERFLPWFDRFLPRLTHREPAALFVPAVASDRSDGKIAHLDGLNLSRAWCFRSLAASLPPGDPRCGILQEAADEHLVVSWPHLAGDYMGEHWLSSFALLVIDEV